MCPMRFLLVFFSALLAGYFAWRTVRASPEVDADGSIREEKPSEDRKLGFKLMVQNGFWVVVDMASGRYLWRNLRSSGEAEEKVKSS